MFLKTHAKECKNIYDMFTDLLPQSRVKTADNCCNSYLFTTA